MPQLHHRDPSIIGLLGSSPFVAAIPPTLPPSVLTLANVKSTTVPAPSTHQKQTSPGPYASEAFDDIRTPPETPLVSDYHHSQAHGRHNFPHLNSSFSTPIPESKRSRQSQRMPVTPFERPFYELIVDGIHSHPNSVRV